MIKNEVILHVEDDPLCWKAVSRVLGVYNEIQGARSLAEAKEKLRQTRFSVLLLDRRLPDGDGFDLIPDVLQPGDAVVIVVLSGEFDFRSVTRGLELGAHDYVVKSDRLVEDLLARLPIAVSRAHNEKKIRSLRGSMSIQLPTELRDLTPGNFKRYLGDVENEYIAAALRLCAGGIGDLARRIGISRSTAFKKSAALKSQKRIESFQ